MRMMDIILHVPIPTNKLTVNGLLAGLFYYFSFFVEALCVLLCSLLLIVEVPRCNVITIADHAIIGEDIVADYPTALSASQATASSSF